MKNITNYLNEISSSGLRFLIYSKSNNHKKLQFESTFIQRNDEQIFLISGIIMFISGDNSFKISRFSDYSYEINGTKITLSQRFVRTPCH